MGLSFLLALVAIFFIIERPIENNPSSQNEESEAVEKSPLSGNHSLEIKTAESNILWQGERTILTTHVNTGTLALVSGSFEVENGVPTEGEFMVDMNSLTLTSVHGVGPREGGGDMLLAHLKSSDFFDVENFSEASFVLTSAEKTEGDFVYTVKGDMTIKGITEEIVFPAEIYSREGNVIVDADLVLDRTRWDVSFGSENVFENLGDKVIADEFMLEIRLIAGIPVGEPEFGL